MLFGGKIPVIAATLAGITSISWAGWKAGDYTELRPVILKEYIEYQLQQQQFIEKLQEQQAQTLQSVLQLRFQTLMLQKQYGALTFAEQQELCQVAKTLEFVGVPGCVPYSQPQ